MKLTIDVYKFIGKEEGSFTNSSYIRKTNITLIIH